ncbi:MULTISPECIES: hypothetical protein [Rhodobacterales]|uniref:Uncharacterized protein n=1 Tax=Halocynthiibacter styelae TaxID=2761955 RepID=A0A8J7IP14_9RHOB|nr:MULTISPECIES: hypothetical protein [Rhodobacterales]MBI1494416.1 hypothetical protein [Paenihalocynthiibacter styelae]
MSGLSYKTTAMRRILAVLFLSALAFPAAADNFTTAGEVRPILTATRSGWVSLRESGGQDVLDFQQIAAWRCGLRAVHYRVNSGGEQALAMESCYEGDPRPNAIRDTSRWMMGHGGGSVQSVSVRIIYDDGREDSVQLSRAQMQ